MLKNCWGASPPDPPFLPGHPQIRSIILFLNNYSKTLKKLLGGKPPRPPFFLLPTPKSATPNNFYILTPRAFQMFILLKNYIKKIWGLVSPPPLFFQLS